MRFIGLIAAAVLTWPLHADESLEVELISEVRGIVPGQEFHLGLHLKHPAGSHTYWKFPGIVGLPTGIEWQLPPGFTAGEIRWPGPEIVEMAGHHAQGYSGETLLIIPILAPPEVAESSVKLAAKVSWMCCGKTCQPAANVPFSLTLPVRETAEIDPATGPVFAKARAAMPEIPSSSKAVSVARHDDKIVLTLEPPGAGTEISRVHFFTADGQVDSDAAQNFARQPDGKPVLTLLPSKTGPPQPPSLPGVVAIPTATTTRFFAVDPRY